MYDDVIEYFTHVKYPSGILTYHDFDDVSNKPEGNRELFVHCNNQRDFDIVHAMACGDKNKFVQPKYDFDKTDFNNFTDIFNSLKDGYLYSKPRQIGDNI